MTSVGKETLPQLFPRDSNRSSIGEIPRENEVYTQAQTLRGLQRQFVPGRPVLKGTPCPETSQALLTRNGL